MRKPGFLLLLLAATAAAQLPDDLKRKFDEAERRIVRLGPEAFPELPANLARELRRRGCTVPQEAFTRKPHNVIRGEFAKPGQTDWAVLCSLKGVSSIMVFWNGSEASPAVLAPAPDLNYIQSIDRDSLGYSRAIGPAGKDFIVGHYRAYGGPTPPPVDHQGINDAFVEKASVVHYWHGGKWLRLTGSD